jgi:photosystem II stability/assembly factor-like uncharacterized protein
MLSFKKLKILISILFISPLYTCSFDESGFDEPVKLFIPGQIKSSEWSLLISSHVSNYNPDCNPWLAANGKKLFFISWDGLNGPPRPGAQGHWDIYMSVWDSVLGDWGPAVNLGPNVNTFLSERHPSATASGDTLFFSREGDIYMTIWNGSEWTPAVELPYPVNTDYYEYDPAITPDGRYLFFCSTNRPGGQGGADIWIARWNGTEWDSVHPLPPPVNTPANEHRPFISSDGQYLYFTDFAGNRPGSLSGDIWVSQKTASGWTEPVPVPPPIRNARNQCSLYITPDGKQFWVGGESFEAVYGGDEDIWVSYYDSFPSPPTFPDSSSNWTRTAELEGAWIVYSLVEGLDGSLYAGTAAHTENGATGLIYKSLDGGNSWFPLDTLPGVQIVYCLLVLSNGAILAGTYPEGKIFKSEDNGETWVNTFHIPGIVEVRGLFETSDHRVLAGVNAEDQSLQGIYVSYDFGDSWSLLSPFPVEKFYEAPDGTLYGAGLPYPAISTDGGANWFFPNSFPFPDVEVKKIECISGTSDGTLYAGGFIYSHGGYVFKSTDNGATWDTTGRIMTGNIHAVRVYSLLPLPNGEIYIGFQPGPDSVVQVSNDGGISWNTTGSLYKARAVHSLLLSGDSIIYAGTSPNGDVFKYALTDVKEDFPKGRGNELSLYCSSILHGRGEVRIVVPENGTAEFSIYDITGRRLKSLEISGSRTIKMNFPKSGIYFYLLKFNNETVKKKIVFLR